MLHTQTWPWFFSFSHAEKKEKPPEKKNNPNEVVYETSLSKTVIIYKKDFVPYTTRIYNFITSFSSPPGNGDK